MRKVMCGRFTLIKSADRIAEDFDLPAVDAFPPRYNIAPTQPILIVLAGHEGRPEAHVEGRQAMLARWGLIPAWAKDPRDLPLLFNARSESVAERAAFRGALRHRRCLVPASGFYEWQKRGKGRSQPFYVEPVGDEPFAFAGLMEHYLAADGSEIDTATILTVGANATLRPIHERMPVVIRAADFERWLDCRNHEPAEVADLLVAAPDEALRAVPISERVNDVANMSPEIQRPAEVPVEKPPADDPQKSFGF